MICYEFLRILEKNRKKGKLENLGKHGLLRHNIGNPRSDLDIRHSVVCLSMARSRFPKKHPSSTPRHSFATPKHSSATPRRRYCSQ